MPAEGNVGQSSEAVASQQQYVAITNLQGAFRVSRVAAGEYMVVALANGYLSPMDSTVVPTEELQGGSQGSDADKLMMKKLRETCLVVQVSGEQTAQADLVLERGAALSGRVLYADGTPAGQVPVSIQNLADDKAKAQNTVNMGSFLRTLVLRQNPTTDDNGHFRIAGVPAGTYRIAVAQTLDNPVNLGEELMEAMQTQTSTPRALVIYSGNTLHRKLAKTYEVHAGENLTDIEITLPLDGLHVVAGTASGKDGVLLNGASLELSDTADPSIAFRGQLHADGSFQFSSVPEGTYELKATGGRIYVYPPNDELPPEGLAYRDQQFKPQRAFADTSISVTVQSADVTDVRLTLPDAKLPSPPRNGPVVLDNDN